ncbi:MAG: ATP-binding protein [Acetobacteraceae bacterium]
MAARASEEHPPGIRNPPVDLTNCDSEPIHIPGTIQPHGILFALSVPDLRVIAVSANVAEHVGRGPEDLLGVPFAALVDEASFTAVADAARTCEAEATRLGWVTLRGSDVRRRAMLHTRPDNMLVELKLLQPDTMLSPDELFDRFGRASRRLQAANDVTAICVRLAQEVRRLTGYDRVKVYRFAADWSGEVIAEDNRGNMPSYLGLHFPAEDIPAQARALYMRNAERQIPDVGYVPVPLVQATGAPIDLSPAVLRSVSPIHVEYLTNMGIGASMSISILRHGTFWGLVACHHASAHYVAPELRQACTLLAQHAAWQIGFVEDAEIARRLSHVRAIETTMLHETTVGQDYRDVLLRNANTILDLLNASGFALCSGGVLTTLGETLAEDDLRALLTFLSGRVQGVFETDHLSAQYPDATGLDGAAGILAVSLGGAPDNLMVWFRPELARTVTWAGEPVKMVAGRDRLTPRRSFAAWTQEVRGRSRPWAAHEIAAANSLRNTIVDIIVRRSLQLEELNSELLRSNQELESFAFIASHDLTEPLRQIETFGSLIERAVGTEAVNSPNLGRWFEGIQSSSRRLRSLIKDLAEYSRLGRSAKPLAPAALDEIVAQVQTDLGRMIEATGASIAVDPLPSVVCDAGQMQQVFQNVLSNALKYRHADRAPVIRIAATLRPPLVGASRNTSHVLDIVVSDNGIGFDERFRDRIFEPFQRLHAAHVYEGSGIGLAICRKIMDRHGGTISARSQPGEGSAFTISLPLHPVSVQHAQS